MDMIVIIIINSSSESMMTLSALWAVPKVDSSDQSHPDRRPHTMTEKTLFDTYRLGSLILFNRIVIAPLTRNRFGADLVPT